MIVTVRARGRIGASVTTAWCALPTRISASRAGARRKRREARPASGDCPHSKHRGCSLCAQNRKEPISRQGADLAYVFLEKKNAALPK